MAKLIEMADVDIAICRCRVVRNKDDDSWHPANHHSRRDIYNAVGEWEKANNVLFPQRLTCPLYNSRKDSWSWTIAKNHTKQELFQWLWDKQEELWDTYKELLKQEEYILQHGNLNGYDGTSECEVCGAVLTGEAKTAQYAYACGEEGRKIHHLHVGNTHFCNLDCFEKYKAKYNQQLNTPKYEE